MNSVASPDCAACDRIPTHRRSAYEHETVASHGNLVRTGVRGYAPHAQAAVNVSMYKCSICGRLWEYEDDRNDPFVGWSLVSLHLP